MTRNPGTPVRRSKIVRRLGGLARRAAAEAEKLRYRLAGGSGDGEAGVDAERVVWIFGSGRTGSTWLSAMMDEMDGHTVWREPLVGALFGNLYYERAGHRIDSRGKHFILGSSYKRTWFGPMREMVLEGAAARFPELLRGGYLVVKEPNGSVGAPLLMEALPESRMVLLVRDPRDVVASSMDARKEGSWLYENRGEEKRRGALPDRKPNAYVKKRARAYLQNIGNSREAYANHKGYKALVRYEDLLGDPPGTMKRMYASLGIEVGEKEILRAIEKHAWENIPEEQKGEGKFYRKATPGGWQEDLTPEQVKIVENITAPLLREFYPD